MIIAVDIGNTALTIGFSEGQTWVHRLTIATDKKQTSSGYSLIINQFIKASQIKITHISDIIISSVVPSLTITIKKVFSDIFTCPIIILGPKIKTGLMLSVDQPSEVGSDLVAVSVAAIEKYGHPVIIADLGTASKIIAIDQKGYFVGVSIAPGLMIAHQALIGNASQLREVDFSIPKVVIGRNTVTALNSGTLYGHAHLIKGLSMQVADELGDHPKLLLTGGYAALIKSLLPQFIYDEDLLLDGLKLILLKNKVTINEKR